MSTTLTIQDGLTFVRGYIKQQSVSVNNQQPGLGIAQIILNIVLGPPFVWRFNRFNFSIPISTGGGTDYPIFVGNLGHIETQWMVDANGKFYELGGETTLARTGMQKQPTKVSPQYDDNAGNITFRFNSIPDKIYTAFFDYQQKAPLITGYAQPLGTVPDEFAHIIFTGLLAWAGMLVNDARFPIWEKRFIADLLAAQDGLDDQAKIIFMGEWMEFTKTAIRSQGAVQGGVGGRNQ
jgi:hypothetical protein